MAFPVVRFRIEPRLLALVLRKARADERARGEVSWVLRRYVREGLERDGLLAADEEMRCDKPGDGLTPTVPGWYWWQHITTSRWSITRVYRMADDSLCIDSGWSPTYDGEDSGGMDLATVLDQDGISHDCYTMPLWEDDPTRRWGPRVRTPAMSADTGGRTRASSSSRPPVPPAAS